MYVTKVKKEKKCAALNVYLRKEDMLKINYLSKHLRKKRKSKRSLKKEKM